LQKQAEMVLGALVADAASLGVHWIYEPARIAELTEKFGSNAFVPIDASHYDGVRGYFAHGARSNGMSTQYGVALRVALDVIAVNEGYDAKAHAVAFAGCFGPGGSYQGYIDRPTRGALGNIAAEAEVTGIDDDQLPATATLPALVAAYHGRADLGAMAKLARHLTNVNEVADHYAEAFTDLLCRLLADVPMADALAGMVDASDDSIQEVLADGLKTPETDSVAFAEVHGRACHLPMAGPLIVQILREARDFSDAIHRNNAAGGDSAGRAIVIGAAMAAVHGVATNKGVPLGWILQLDEADAIWAGCQKVVFD